MLHWRQAKYHMWLRSHACIHCQAAMITGAQQEQRLCLQMTRKQHFSYNCNRSHCQPSKHHLLPVIVHQATDMIAVPLHYAKTLVRWLSYSTLLNVALLDVAACKVDRVWCLDGGLPFVTEQVSKKQLTESKVLGLGPAIRSLEGRPNPRGYGQNALKDSASPEGECFYSKALAMIASSTLCKVCPRRCQIYICSSW